MLQGVVGGERLVVDVDLDIRIEVQQPVAGRLPP